MRQWLLLVIGLGTLGIAWLGPLPQLVATSFTTHMTLHMLVVAVAAPILAMAIADGAADPVLRFPNLFAPIIASIAELVLIWMWHAPALHHVARMTWWGFALEQVTFVLAGLWLWLSALGGPWRLDGLDATARESVTQRRCAGVLGLLLTSMHMTLLGALIALSQRPLFPLHVANHGSLAGPSIEESASMLADQQLGGAVMLVVGGVAYLAGGLALVAQVVPESTPLHRTGRSL